MLVDGKSRRFEERQGSSLGVLVRGREGADEEWAEATYLLDVSRAGARFTLDRAPESGQPLHLTLALARHLRAYDHAEKDYCVWAVARTIKVLTVQAAERPRYEVGVAFIGKFAPPGFLLDPTARYDLKPLPTRQGLWAVRQRPRGAGC